MKIDTYEKAQEFLLAHNHGDHHNWAAFGERLEGVFNQSIFVEAAYMKMRTGETLAMITVYDLCDGAHGIVNNFEFPFLTLKDREFNSYSSFLVEVGIFNQFINNLMMGFGEP